MLPTGAGAIFLLHKCNSIQLALNLSCYRICIVLKGTSSLVLLDGNYKFLEYERVEHGSIMQSEWFD